MAWPSTPDIIADGDGARKSASSENIHHTCRGAGELQVTNRLFPAVRCSAGFGLPLRPQPCDYLAGRVVVHGRRVVVDAQPYVHLLGNDRTRGLELVPRH